MTAKPCACPSTACAERRTLRKPAAAHLQGDLLRRHEVRVKRVYVGLDRLRKRETHQAVCKVRKAVQRECSRRPWDSAPHAMQALIKPQLSLDRSLMQRCKKASLAHPGLFCKRLRVLHERNVGASQRVEVRGMQLSELFLQALHLRG